MYGTILAAHCRVFANPIDPPHVPAAIERWWLKLRKIDLNLDRRCYRAEIERIAKHRKLRMKLPRSIPNSIKDWEFNALALIFFSSVFIHSFEESRFGMQRLH